MAADRFKRRLSSAAALGYEVQHGHYIAKKRDLKLIYDNSNDGNYFNSHISLKWDDNGKRVVALEDQVGISWRHLNPFVVAPAPPRGANSKLGDVVHVSRDIFELDDLTQVLSYEVWQSVLTEDERNHLLHFLPQELDPDQLVRTLFSGDNFHFGNPCQKWGASLCSGDVHPDSIIRHEKSLKTLKNENYFQLQQYHDNMIRNLQKLKERCASSNDPDGEILQMMSSRSRRYDEKSISPDANGSKSFKPEENALAISQSPSTADDKSYYSDNKKLSDIRDMEIKRSDEGLKERHEKLATRADGVKISPKPKKGEKLQKANINVNDGAKYMSYLKISKKQHELVKSMKQSGSSIQSKTLYRVLGNLDSTNVKPYEMFIEEEQKKIHEFWLNLASKDIPVVLHKRRIMQLEKRQIMDSLLHEMKEKQNLLTEGDKMVDLGMHLQLQDEKMANSHDEETADPLDTDEESSQGTPEHHQIDTVSQGSVSDDDKESNPSMQNQPPSADPPFSVNEGFGSSSLENQHFLDKAPLSISEESDISPTHNQSSGGSSFNVKKEVNAMDLNVDANNVRLEKSDFCSTPTERNATAQISEGFGVPHSGSDHPISSASLLEIPCSPAKNEWASVGLPESFRSIPVTQYASSSVPYVQQPQVFPAQPAALIDLESDLSEADNKKDLLNEPTNHLPFFNPYPNRDRSELLQSLIKNENHLHEQKKTGVEYNPSTKVILQSSLFPSNVQEQLAPSYGMDNKPKSDGQQLCMNPNFHESLFSASNSREWSDATIPTPVQTQFSSGESSNHDWFVSENQTHGDWSGSDTSFAPHSSLESGSGEDQSLFSVLSQCKTLRSQALYNPVGSTDVLTPPTNYGQDMAGGISMTNSGIPQAASPFAYMGGTQGAVTLKNTGLSWMSLGQQDSELHDPSGKPYPKSWNQ